MKKVCRGVLTALRSSASIEVSQRAGAGLPPLRLLEMEFPDCRSCGVRTLLKSMPKLIENRGFECI